LGAFVLGLETATQLSLAQICPKQAKRAPFVCIVDLELELELELDCVGLQCSEFQFEIPNQTKAKSGTTTTES
jgi:hypothetical protein